MKPRITYYVVLSGGIEQATILPYFDSVGVTLVGQTGLVEDVAGFFSKSILPVNSDELCQMANTAVRECPTEFAALLFSENVGFDVISGKPSAYDECSPEDLLKYCEDVADMIEAFGAECGGFCVKENTRLWGIAPYSTVHAPSPFAAVIRKEEFSGFRKLSFPFVVYDYFLRSLWSKRVVIRHNGVATSYPTYDTEQLKEFTALADAGVIQHRVAHAKTQKAFIEFTTPYDGV